MRRITLICATALLALAPAALARHRADTPGLTGPVAKTLACDMAGPDRSALFYGRMEAIPGATRMAIRFTLLERLGRGDDFDKADVPDLKGWHRSAPGVKTFAYKQTVDNLRSGGAYKARVQYRWYTAAGLVLDSTTRDTPICRGQLPNLEPAGLEVQAGPTADTRTYRVTVANAGKADADDVDVALSVDRAGLDTATIQHLDAGDSHTVSFVGPVCNRAMRVRVDPSNTVGELFEDDNSQLYGC